MNFCKYRLIDLPKSQYLVFDVVYYAFVFFRDHFMKEFISFETYANDAIKLADMIKKTGRTFKSIIVITRGGLIPEFHHQLYLNKKQDRKYRSF